MFNTIFLSFYRDALAVTVYTYVLRGWWRTSNRYPYLSIYDRNLVEIGH